LCDNFQPGVQVSAEQRNQFQYYVRWLACILHLGAAGTQSVNEQGVRVPTLVGHFLSYPNSPD